MSRKVVHLHIGAPKTGTTYVQDRLTRNAAALERHGVVIPTSSRFVDADLFHFRAALDLLGQDWGGPPGHAAGAWPTLLKRIDSAKGHSAVVSHEILAPAKPDKVARAVHDLAAHDLRIVYSARDLGRQVPAAWQESIKQGRGWSYRRFLSRVARGNAWFYRAFDLPSVLEKWGAQVPSDRITVVTVPQRGVVDLRGDVLWLRMCEAFGIDPAWAPTDSERLNRSLGLPETAVLRQLNRRLARAVRRDAHSDEVILDLAHRALADRQSPSVKLPPDRYDWADEQAQRWIDWLADSGITVIGDPEDLRPVRPSDDEEWRDPDRVGNKLKLNAALDALTAMTEEAARRTPPDRQLAARVRAGVGRLRGR